MANKEKSILKEAITDFDEIMEAADANAKKKLAAEFPEKFSNLLKEEIKNKDNKAKESYKKLDEAKEKNEPMKKEVKETVKVVKTVGSSDPFKEKPKGVAKVEEDVKIIDTIGDSDPFDEKAKKSQKVDEIVTISDTIGDGDPFDKKVKKSQKVDETAGDGKPFNEKAKKLETVAEEFDISQLDTDEVGSALDGADNEDQIITIDEIESEISGMEGLGEEDSPSYMKPNPQPNQGGVAYQELVKLRDNLQEVINSMGVNEMHQGNFDLDKMHKGQYDSKLIDEEAPITEEDIDAVLGSAPAAPAAPVTQVQEEEEPVVDEAKGIAYSDGTITPGKLGDHEGTHGRFRGTNESEDKKITGVIEENKKLTKKLNESKKQEKEVNSLLESYKTALEKYRNQLKEMAVFNTNLAHVNNILVNEELALTQEDKIKIINEFKEVDNITDSQKKYKKVLSEMKESRKTISESIEEKVSTSIQPSSKQKLDEVIEKTAYADNAHMARMKKVIDYVERRGKK